MSEGVTEADDGCLVTINVGGTKLQTLYSTIERYDSSKLYRLVHSKRKTDSINEHITLFVDRSPKYFKVILELYRSGSVHLAPGLCWYRLKEEMEFWELDARAYLPPCCSQRVLELEEKEILEKKLEKQLDTCCAPQLNHGCCGGDAEPNSIRWKCGARVNQIWLFLEDPTSSIYAQIWGIVFLVVVLLSVFVQVAITHPLFRIDLPKPSWNITGVVNPKLILFATTEVSPMIWKTEMFCFVVFGGELILRFITCPSKVTFIKSVFSIIDILCLIPMLIIVVLESMDHRENRKQIFFVAYYLSIFGVFRILRLFKFLRHFLCIRVLLLALKASIREISLLFILLMVGVLLFSNLIYFAELYVDDQFETIPIGFWWAVVTMTTVGYGDKHPRSGWGYVIGAACAMCGMLLIGIPIPAIANNFSMLYTLARQKSLQQNRDKEAKKFDLSTYCCMAKKKKDRYVISLTNGSRTSSEKTIVTTVT